MKQVSKRERERERVFETCVKRGGRL
jgi:hypothetical protein